MHAGRLNSALKNLSTGIQEVEKILGEMRAEHDPLAVHIFLSRRDYRKMDDTKSGKRHERSAWTSYREASDLGFRGSIEEWRRLLGAAART